MDRLGGYYRNFQSLRGNIGGLPPWARTVVWIAALPGIALILLSLLALGVSILALLLLTVPLYRLLKSVAGGSTAMGARQQSSVEVFGADLFGNAPGRRRVEAKVVDSVPTTDPGQDPPQAAT